jgi:hypothetical protein
MTGTTFGPEIAVNGTRPDCEFDNATCIRFWSRVATSSKDECWLWTARSQTDNGRTRGKFSANRKDYFAHRVAAIIFHGKPADGLECLHSCDNPMCCNPYHLSWGTHLQNMRDCRSRGRNITAEKLVCKRGHSLTPGNLIHMKNPRYRVCKTCSQNNKRRYRAEGKVA